MTDGELPDFSALAQRARQLQGEFSSMQSDLTAVKGTGFGGGGMVTATVSGEGRLVGLQIDPSVIDPGDPETLAGLVIAAVDGANEAMAEQRNERMTEVTEGLQSMLNGLRPVRPAEGRPVPRFAPRRQRASPPAQASRPGGQAEDTAGG
jgi:nucleoid-associated protein EbfC